MLKPNFCPFDGKDLDLKNLAYEIVPARGWDWERIKAETIIGTDIKQYIDECDGKRDHFLGRPLSGKRVMLLASREKKGKNGLCILKEFVENGGKKKDAAAGSSYEETMKQMYSATISLPFFMNPAGAAAEKEDFVSEGPIRLHYALYKGIETFFDENEDPVFYALPCCPYCHNRLPAGWDQADDFIGISILGPEGSGKTSLRYSLLHENCKAFDRIRLPDGSICSVEPAYYENELADPDYEKLKAGAERMCRKNGECPKTEEDAWNRLPLFLRVRYGNPDKGKMLLVGLYDWNPSDPEGVQPAFSQNTGRLTEKMYADLYLLDPGREGSLHLRRKRRTGSVKLSACKMMTPEEQARFQKQNREVCIQAQDLLNGIRTDVVSELVMDVEKQEGESLAEVFARRMRYYRSMQEERQVKKMHCIGAIVKNDLLPAKKALAEEFADVLTADGDRKPVDLQAVIQRSESSEQLLKKVSLLDEGLLQELKDSYGAGMSWHCVSALGCDAFERDHLLGEYGPVHVADPVVMCIRSRLIENKWR